MAIVTIGSFLLQLLVSLILSVVAYVIAPKPKKDAPEELKDLEVPTSESGRPIPVVFGDITVKSPNILWFGEKRTEVKEV